MTGDEEDPRRRFRLIEGFLDRPRPRASSWPRRYQVVRVRRSVRRPRSGSFKPEYLEEIGVLLRETKPGSSRKRREKKGKLPPLRMEQRRARALLQAASQEEKERLVTEAWNKLMSLRDSIRYEMCIDPDGSGGLRSAPRLDGRTYRPSSWDQVRPGGMCCIAELPGVFRIEAVEEIRGQRYARMVDECGFRHEVWTLESLELFALTPFDGAERFEQHPEDLISLRDYRFDLGIDPNG